MANNDEYTDEITDEYNDEYLCRDFFVGFNFWSRLSFQISEFRVHCITHVEQRRRPLHYRSQLKIHRSKNVFTVARRK